MKHHRALRTGLSPPSMAASASDRDFRVVDNLPPEIPVTQAEIDLLARFCRDLLDEYCRSPSAPARAARGPVSAGLNRKAGRK